MSAYFGSVTVTRKEDEKKAVGEREREMEGGGGMWGGGDVRKGGEEDEAQPFVKMCRDGLRQTKLKTGFSIVASVCPSR